jgi:signal peptidase II
VSTKQARRNDILAFLTVIVVIALDQWTKSLVVQRLSPPESQPPIPLIGQYLTIYYIQNVGAAFSMFANTYILAILIAIAIGLIVYLYARMINNGSLMLKLIFGMIIGGAAANLIDRAIRAGRVVDFIFFRIPQIGFSFAIFNIADAAISVGVFLLFVFILFGGLRKSKIADAKQGIQEREISSPAQKNGTLRPTEQDAQP